MRQLPNIILFAVLLLSLPSASFAQLPAIFFSGSASYSGGVFQGNASFRLPMPPIPLMVNAPYSGQQEIETSQTLQGGVRINRPSRLGQKFWRDSQGRIRVERSFASGSGRVEGVPTLVQIQDPVAGYTYIMDDVNKVAHRIKVSVVQQPNLEEVMKRDLSRRESPAQSAPRPGSGPAENAPRPAAAQRADAGSPPPVQSSLQDLGTQVIDGVVVHGTRVVTVTPAGYAGADGPISNTRDMWYSPDLNMIIRTVLGGPLLGTQTERVANLSRSEPDSSLFVVPADYRIVDETAGFEITWGK